jgi:hypothetical protein
MATLSHDHRTRRSVLAAGVAGFVGTVVAATDRRAARAADGDPLLIGRNNTGTTWTELTESGLFVDVPDGTGIYAIGGGKPGASLGDPAASVEAPLKGEGGDACGVLGVTGSWEPPPFNDPGYVGVLGVSARKTGVYGATGSNPPSAVPSNTGVYGWSEPGAGVGVRGRNDGGFGFGVFGLSNNGSGVAGYTKAGVAVSAVVGSKGTGLALSASGRVAFSAAGTLTIQSGHQLGTITPEVALKSSSIVLATLQSDAGPGIGVEYAYVVLYPPRLTAPYIGVRLTSPATMDAKIAYFIVEG